GAETKVTSAGVVGERVPLPEEITSGVSAANPLPPPDSPTGLFARCDAEAAMRESRWNGTRSFATVFVIDRLRHINSRFGQPVGDRLTVLFLQRLAGALFSEDRLFRWGESSFVALLENRDSQDEVRRQIERILFK